jgi:signal transduction histidine kinase
MNDSASTRPKPTHDSAATRPNSRWRVGLRARVAITFAALGLVVSTCVALVAIHFSDSYVHRLINEMLRVEGDYLHERFTADGRTPHPHTKHFYVYNAGSGAPPPADIAALPPGLHEVADARGERHIAVYETAAGRLYVVLDIGLESVRERRLFRDLLALVLFGTGLSAWLGWLWAGRAIAPVRRLARQVEILEPSRLGAAKLAPDFAVDEVGALAQAFDRYQEKLYEYMRRERAFTADASHELRTPLAVIRGAVEVMLDTADTAAAARLKRMQRGADELRDLLDALLVLARSDDAEVNTGYTPDLDVVVGNLLRERADALRERQLQIEHTGAAGIAVAAPPRVLGVIIGNLLRAITQFAVGGTLRVEVVSHTVRIALHSPTSGAAAETSERVLGLSMIRRVCERWGWTLEEQSTDNGDHAFTLRLRAWAAT